MATPSRLETLDTLRVANLDVAFATAFGTLFGGSLMVGFVQHLGGNDYWLGLLGAIPALMGLAQIPGAAFGRGHASFKKYVRRGGLTWRLLYLPIVFIPFIPVPTEVRLFLLILMLGIASFAVNLVNPIYTEWIGKIVPERSRGWYFSQRTIIATITGMIVGLIGARLLDVFQGTTNEAAGYAIIFGSGWIFGMISQYFFERMSDSTREEVVKPSIKSTIDVIREPMRDKNFRRIMAFVAFIAISQGFAGNLFSAFALETLKINFTVLQITSVASAVGTLLSVKIFGFLADRYGNKPLLLLMTAGVTTTPIMWMVCQPGNVMQNVLVLGIGHIFVGIFWSGVGISQMNLYLASSNASNRANYLAAALTVNSLALALSPLAGSWMLATLRPFQGAEWAYKYVFLAVAVQRVIALLLLMRVKEKGAESFTETVRQLTEVRPKSFAALRAVRRGSDEPTRLGAIRSMGESKMSLGTSELHDALFDTSPRIRREATYALGRLRTLAAAEALLDYVNSHPEHIEEESIEALGDCGHVLALPFLTQTLQHPSSILRRAAAKALGRIGDPKAIESLRQAATQPGDPDIRRAALQALRNLEATDPTLYADALFEGHPSVRIAAAEAISELNIPSLAENLRNSLEWFPDEAASEVAYALGTVGEESDLRSILQAASLSVSSTKQRRCLLGAAKLFDLDRELYRLYALEQVTRDSELLRHYRALSRRNPTFAKALEYYSSGEEAHALAALAESDQARFSTWAEFAVPESFLVAALLFEKHHASD